MSMQQDDRPQPVDDRYSSPPPSSSSSGNGGRNARIMQILLPLVMSVVVVFVFSTWLFPSVKQADFTTNFQNVAQDIKTLQGRMSELDTLKTQLTDLSKTYSTKTEVANVDKKINDLTSQGYAKSSDLKSVQDGLKTVQDSVNTLKSTATNPADSAAVKSMQDQIKTLNDSVLASGKKITELETQVKALKEAPTTTPTSTPTPTPTTTPTPTSTNPYLTSTQGVVTATLQPTITAWNGSPIMSMTVQPPSYGTVTNIQVTNGGSGYTSVPTVVISAPTTTGGTLATAHAVLNGDVVSGISITNVGSGYVSAPTVTISGGAGTGAVASVVSFTPLQAYSASASITLNLSNSGVSTIANNIQLALGLAVVDGNGNPIGSTPTWITPGNNLTVSSNFFGSSWSYQSVATPSTYVFYSANSSGLFYQGITLQPKQQSTMVLYVTVTNSNPSISQNISFMPMIKVQGYTAS